MVESKKALIETVKSIYTLPNEKVCPLWLTITNGLYSVLLKEWFGSFKDKFKTSNLKFHFINGDEIAENLPEIMLKYEKIFKLPSYFKSENFIRDSETGFYCYKENQYENNALYPPVCLTDARQSKGKTRDGNGEELASDTVISEENIALLDEFYRPYNQEFFRKYNLNATF